MSSVSFPPSGAHHGVGSILNHRDQAARRAGSPRKGNGAQQTCHKGSGSAGQRNVEQTGEFYPLVN